MRRCQSSKGIEANDKAHFFEVSDSERRIK